MKSFLTLIFVLLAIAQAMSQAQDIFRNFSDKDSVVIALKQYGLKELPEDIGRLTQAITLVVSPDSIKNQWTIYPPLEAFDEYIDNPPFRYLPDAITTLSKLKYLSLRQLAIKKLPKDFDRLVNLEELDLSINKLTIRNEINKLKNLKKLRRLILFGNRVTKQDIMLLKEANPALFIDLEDYFEK